jgi:TonB family protein
MVVDSEGHTKNIRIVSGAGMGLEEQAIGAVRTWRFQPATRNGQAVPVMINVEVNFRLYGPKVVSPLFPGRESKTTPPQFPGADLIKYPLLVFIKSAYGVPVDDTYEVAASGTIEQPVKQQLSITCNNKKHHCPYIQSGRYPARWLTEGQRIEIIGKETPDGGWKKAEYTVKSEAPKPPS